MSLLNYNNIPKYDEIKDRLISDGYIICDDVIEKKIFEKIQKYWIKRFDNLKQEKLKSYDRNFVFRLGEENFAVKSENQNDYRFKIQEFLWNEIENTTKDIIIEMHQFTNLSKGLNKNRGLQFTDSKNALSLSVNYYPPEKGYLSPHQDVPDFIMWVIFTLTFKGKHFDEGGLYLISKKGEKIDISQKLKPGSILFFNGSFKHGVDRIKSKKQIGYLSVFPFPINFYNQKTIPKFVKTFLKIYDKIISLLNPQKKVRRGLDY